MKKILVVFGTRPEAIKMAPLLKEMYNHPDKLEVILCVTGQHREMLHQVLDIFNLVPDYDLSLMQNGQDLFDISARVLTGMRDVLNEVEPDLVIVHGDTTTSTMVALASFYKKIPVAHVEAGLRTFDIYSPWPEELNRQLTSKIVSFHFAPTEAARQNLIRENIAPDKIIVTGNTVIDALYWVKNQFLANKSNLDNIVENLAEKGYDISHLDSDRKMVLITGHRRENFGPGFISICNAIKTLADKYKDTDFIFPMHLNPNVRNAVSQVFGEDFDCRDNVFLLEPLDYISFIFLMDKSSLILTDSGGVQEESAGLGKPVVIMRDITERAELTDSAQAKLVGTDFDKIISAVSGILDNSSSFNGVGNRVTPFGDGMAARRIVEHILHQII